MTDTTTLPAAGRPVAIDPDAGFRVDTGKGTRDGRVSSQWFSRPADQRYTSLSALEAAVAGRRETGREAVVRTDEVRVVAAADDAASLRLVLPGSDAEVHPTHWSFGQLCDVARAPRAYLRDLPASLAGINLQYGLAANRAGFAKSLVTDDGRPELRAVTGPDYGRIWDAEVVRAVRGIAGDGTGDTRWKIPGCLDWSTSVYKPRAAVTSESTTLYASDHDVFLFLVDDLHPVEAGRSPDGTPDLYFRGFYVWNSETGARSAGVSTFWLRAVCQNRNLWGQEGKQTLTIRHSKFAPGKFAAEAAPRLEAYARSDPSDFLAGIGAAKARVVADDDEEALGFLTGSKVGLTRPVAQRVMDAVLGEEGVPARSLWDMVQGITAVARAKEHTDERIELERVGGRLLAKAA